MSEFYGPVSDRGDALNLMDVAFEQGVRVFDTADFYGISHFQVILAWLFAQSSSLLPIPGSRKIANLLANVEAESIILEDPTLSELSALFTSKTIAGGRYTINKEVAANAAVMSDN